jgi:large subunit ribosomal protein L21
LYAVIQTGGKQYKVAPGETVDVERLTASAGDTVELSQVLLVADGEKIMVGRPLVEGAKVMTTVAQHTRGPKIEVYKFKAKKRYRRHTGHRQELTRLTIGEIIC